jgi:hypothetical protein
MAVPTPEVVFERMDGYCGRARLETWVAACGPEIRATVAYDPRCRRDPRRLALHEVCHLRMRHHFMLASEITGREMEREVKTCMAAYEQRARR